LVDKINLDKKQLRKNVITVPIMV